MNKFLLFSYFIIPSVICISIIDYYVFRRWIKCPICGYTENSWIVYLPANLLEIFFLLAGIFFGMMAVK